MDKLDISTLNELNILWKINHEYLIKYYDHFDLNTSTRSYMCLVTEYCDVKYFYRYQTFYHIIIIFEI